MSVESMDISILLDLLQLENEKCPSKDTTSAQLVSLESLTGMCIEPEATKTLRMLNGLSIIWKLCCNTRKRKVAQNCLFTLASISQNDVYAQQELCCESVFSSINILLSSENICVNMRTFATYFVLSLVSKNKQGQDFIRTSGCLDTLMKLFAKYAECFFCHATNNVMEADKSYNYALSVIIKTLSYAVNVPQNDKNQTQVSKIFPWVINSIHKIRKQPDTLGLLCTFISVTVENNTHCQEVALSCRCIEVFIIVLNRALSDQENKSIGDVITALIHSLPTEGQHWSKFIALGGPLLLIRLLEHLPSEYWASYQLTETLGLLVHCMEQQNLEILVDVDKVAQVIVKLMNEMPEDQYFLKTAIKLLNYFLTSKRPPLNEDNHSPIYLDQAQEECRHQKVKMRKYSRKSFDNVCHFKSQPVIENEDEIIDVEAVSDVSCGSKRVVITPPMVCKSGQNHFKVLQENPFQNLHSSRNDIQNQPDFNNNKVLKSSKYKTNVSHLSSNKSQRSTQSTVGSIQRKAFIKPQNLSLRYFLKPKLKRPSLSKSIAFTSESTNLTRPYKTPNELKQKYVEQCDIDDAVSLCTDIIEDEFLRSRRRKSTDIPLCGTSGVFQFSNKKHH
ncbi:telomere repeats-binding bouquet formation protein 1-like [Clavelina lepadiformis]|uniref:telomere repeats-binding bouquet formation protein 1-like n=1 Tax=Clavelina lepadiformis TaxID=159417 RepID=UPI0040419413